MRNTKECSMTYRQSETYSHKNASKTYHYSLFHPRGIFRWSWMKQAVVLLDETGCSGKFLRHFYDYIYIYIHTSKELYSRTKDIIAFVLADFILTKIE